ncbi:hypothetical protein GCM10009765_63230 [Fodinicola feengrottensis]|uniref:Uncharacterized protein n=1 Tax=Fodinicola feengrottensis TaxID=435914 RepID=A0ABN2II61_9ACTN
MPATGGTAPLKAAATRTVPTATAVTIDSDRRHDLGPRRDRRAVDATSLRSSEPAGSVTRGTVGRCGRDRSPPTLDVSAFAPGAFGSKLPLSAGAGQRTYHRANGHGISGR